MIVEMDVCIYKNSVIFQPKKNFVKKTCKKLRKKLVKNFVKKLVKKLCKKTS